MLRKGFCCYAPFSTSSLQVSSKKTRSPAITGWFPHYWILDFQEGMPSFPLLPWKTTEAYAWALWGLIRTCLAMSLEQTVNHKANLTTNSSWFEQMSQALCFRRKTKPFWGQQPIWAGEKYVLPRKDNWLLLWGCDFVQCFFHLQRC